LSICGIVKLPRVPVADNIPGARMPRFRNLWKHIRTRMPKQGCGKARTPVPRFPLFFTLRAPQMRQGKAQRAGNSSLSCQAL